jgi:hypothetical protein
VREGEKQVEGPDLEHEEEQKETLLAEHKGEEALLPEFAGESVRDMERERGSTLLDAMRMILDGKELEIRELGIAAREARALEALQAATSGRAEMNMFVFAADRRSLLEQALAVLQPNLSNGQQTQLAELRQGIDLVTKRVAALRERLIDLEDAQDELMEGRHDKAGKAATTKPGDKPSDPDAPRPASTLAGPGPEVKREDKTTTLTTGPEAKLETVPTTLTAGPEVKREVAPSTLAGPEVKREELPSTLSGPELDAEPEPPTSLGEPEEIEKAAANKPWWRRPFG